MHFVDASKWCFSQIHCCNFDCQISIPARPCKFHEIGKTDQFWSRFWDHFKTRKYSMSQCLTKNILNKYLFEKKIVPVTVKMQRRRISSLTTYIYTSNIIQYPPTLFLEILDVSLWFTLTCIKCMFFGTKSQLSTEEYLLHPPLNFYSKNL